MATLSRVGSQYRDGVFSRSSPAPRYGSLLTAFENGSLGSLEEDAVALLDPALKALQSLLSTSGYAQASDTKLAIALADRALSVGADDVQLKLALASAASYAASHFGFPANDLPTVIARVFGSFAMTSNQRNAVRQSALAIYEAAVAKQKGNAMSGVIRDGVLGSAYKDGVLGALMYQNGAYRDGALGRAILRKPLTPIPITSFSNLRRARRRAMSGLGGCGCSGVGDDAAVVPSVETPFYKKPVVLAGGAAIGLGVLIYAFSRKK